MERSVDQIVPWLNRLLEEAEEKSNAKPKPFPEKRQDELASDLDQVAKGRMNKSEDQAVAKSGIRRGDNAGRKRDSESPQGNTQQGVQIRPVAGVRKGYSVVNQPGMAWSLITVDDNVRQRVDRREPTKKELESHEKLSLLFGQSFLALATSEAVARRALAQAESMTDRWTPPPDLAPIIAEFPKSLTFFDVHDPRRSGLPQTIGDSPRVIVNIQKFIKVFQAEYSAEVDEDLVAVPDLRKAPEKVADSAPSVSSQMLPVETIRAMLFPSLNAAWIDDRGLHFISRTAFPWLDDQGIFNLKATMSQKNGPMILGVSTGFHSN